MSQQIESIKTDYICDQNLQHIDVYFKDKEQGTTAAYLCLDTNKVITKDSELIHDATVKEAISKLIGSRKYLFPNGFSCWKETHFEVVEAITLEIEKDKPRGTVNERHEAQGMGGLYELAEELTTEFETIHKGHEWESDFFDEMDEFTRIRLYDTNQTYLPQYKNKNI